MLNVLNAQVNGLCHHLHHHVHHHHLHHHHHYYLLAEPGMREFGLLMEGELQRPRPPGDFDRFLIQGDR